MGLAAGNLPAGLSLSSAGVISGIPAAVATANFSVTVTGSNGLTTTNAFAISIAPGAPVITTVIPLKSGTVGFAYSQTFAATDGTTPYTWAKSAGTLPAGLTLSSAGVLSGAPTTAATASFTLKATGANGLFSTKAFSLTTVATIPPTILNASTFPSGAVGTPYSLPVGASGGVQPYRWYISAGTLPPGLRLVDRGTFWSIDGTPTAVVTTSFTLQVIGADGGASTKACTLAIAAPAPTITTSSPLASGAVGVAYNQTLAATGGIPPYTWSVASGSLPGGLSMSSAGVLSGTPTQVGTASFSVRV